MPENEDFILEILVGSVPLPEYHRNDDHYVESNLCTPYSYHMSASDFVCGETETQLLKAIARFQSWPVTPYSIRLTAKLVTDTYYYRINVDGVKVKAVSLTPGQSRIIKGFRDGPCLREFLFSLPRFAKDESDRLEAGRQSQIGLVTVECWNAILKHTKYGIRKNFLDFKQANKKDAGHVTQGQHMMATSKAGKVVGSRSLYRCVDSWKLQSLRSQLQVHYHMGHTLQDMGFTLIPVNWSKDKEAPRHKRPSHEKIPSDDDNPVIVKEETTPDIKLKQEPSSTSQSADVVDLTMESEEESDSDTSVGLRADRVVGLQADTVVGLQADTVNGDSDLVIDPQTDTVNGDSDLVIDPQTDTVNGDSDSVIDPQTDTVNGDSDPVIAPQTDTVNGDSDPVIAPQTDTVNGKLHDMDNRGEAAEMELVKDDIDITDGHIGSARSEEGAVEAQEQVSNDNNNPGASSVRDDNETGDTDKNNEDVT